MTTTFQTDSYTYSYISYINTQSRKLQMEIYKQTSSFTHTHTERHTQLKAHIVCSNPRNLQFPTLSLFLAVVVVVNQTSTQTLICSDKSAHTTQVKINIYMHRYSTQT